MVIHLELNLINTDSRKQRREGMGNYNQFTRYKLIIKISICLEIG